MKEKILAIEEIEFEPNTGYETNKIVKFIYKQ